LPVFSDAFQRTKPDLLDKGGGVDLRFRKLLDTGAVSRYEYVEAKFNEAIGKIGELFTMCCLIFSPSRLVVRKNNIRL
jgi:hypothetical protein